MEVMYIKYMHGVRHSTIKEGENIMINESKIIPFQPIKKEEINKHNIHFNNKKNIINTTFNDNTNEEITTFFFDAIHKNYLSTRKNIKNCNLNLKI